MKLEDFVFRVENDDRLRGLDMHLGDVPTEDAVIVEDVKTGFKTRFSVAVILELDWEELRGLATGDRDIQPLYHVARIVGYFSRTENWNKSKIGELRDRRAGNYAIAC